MECKSLDQMEFLRVKARCPARSSESTPALLCDLDKLLPLMEVMIMAHRIMITIWWDNILQQPRPISCTWFTHPTPSPLQCACHSPLTDHTRSQGGMFWSWDMKFKREPNRLYDTSELSNFTKSWIILKREEHAGSQFAFWCFRMFCKQFKALQKPQQPAPHPSPSPHLHRYLKGKVDWTGVTDCGGWEWDKEFLQKEVHKVSFLLIPLISQLNLVRQHGLDHWPSSPSLLSGPYYFALLGILVSVCNSLLPWTHIKPSEQPAWEKQSPCINAVYPSLGWNAFCKHLREIKKNHSLSEKINWFYGIKIGYKNCWDHVPMNGVIMRHSSIKEGWLEDYGDIKTHGQGNFFLNWSTTILEFCFCFFFFLLNPKEHSITQCFYMKLHSFHGAETK